MAVRHDTSSGVAAFQDVCCREATGMGRDITVWNPKLLVHSSLSFIPSFDSLRALFSSLLHFQSHGSENRRAF